MTTRALKPDICQADRDRSTVIMCTGKRAETDQLR